MKYLVLNTKINFGNLRYFRLKVQPVQSDVEKFQFYVHCLPKSAKK